MNNQTEKTYISRTYSLRTLKDALIYRASLSQEYSIKLNLCWNNQEGFFLFGYKEEGQEIYV